MIARIWYGWTKQKDAETYEQMLRDDIFPGIAQRNIKVITVPNYLSVMMAMKLSSLRY